MSQKNETAVLVLALLITGGLIGGGFWWFTKSGINLGQITSQDNNSPGTDDSNSPRRLGESDGSFASVQNVPTGLFNYGGSTSWAPIRVAIDPVLQTAKPQFQLRYVEPIGELPGSASGIRMLLDGRLAFAQSSRPILDQE